MFKIGEQVAHYKEGVCKVINIGKLDMKYSDKKKDYYTLKPLYNAGGTIYVPVGTDTRQLRGIISHNEANELIEEMPDIDALAVDDEKRREVMYKEALFRNQCRSWVSLIKASYMRKKERILAGKKVIGIDERYLSNAERFLYGELAIVLKMPRETVQSYIAERMNDNYGTGEN